MGKFRILLQLLLILALFATTTPIFGGYLIGFLLLLTFLAHAVVVRLKGRENTTEHEQIFGRMAKDLFKPVHLGVAVYVLLQITSEYLSFVFANSGQTWADVQKVCTHFLVKNALLWAVLSSGVQLAFRKGWRPDKAQAAFAIWMFVYAAYCVVQRYTGIDWAKGTDGVLGPHRFAYGVYRVSGAMGHPLTLGYNLVLLLVGAVSYRSLAQVSTEHRAVALWSMTGVFALFILCISGSRFPLGLAGLLLSIMLINSSGGLGRFGRRRWPWAVGAIGFCVVILWMEGATVARFGEMLEEGRPLQERFPRLVFWQVHAQMFMDHPLIGSGIAGSEHAANRLYDALGHTGERYGAHNMVLQELADSGLVGLVGLLSLWGGVALSVKRYLAGLGLSRTRPKFLLTAYLLLAAVLASLLQNNYRDSEFLYAWWLWLALGTATAACRLTATHVNIKEDLRNDHPSRLSS